MTKKEVIKEFCKLSAEVGDYYKAFYATDCFCGATKFPNEAFSFSCEVMEFITSAIYEKMHREPTGNDMPPSLEQMAANKERCYDDASEDRDI